MAAGARPIGARRVVLPSCMYSHTMYLARVCRVAWLLPGDKLVGPTSPNCSRWSPVSRIVAGAVRLKVCNAPILSVPNATCMHAMSHLSILYPGRRGRRAHCRCLLQLPPSWPSRTSLPPPPPSPLPSPPPSLPPSQRQRLLPSEPPPSPSGPHRRRPRRLESEPPLPPPSLSPL